MNKNLLKLQAGNRNLKLMIEKNDRLVNESLQQNLNGVNEMGRPGLIERIIKLSDVSLIGVFNSQGIK